MQARDRVSIRAITSERVRLGVALRGLRSSARTPRAFGAPHSVAAIAALCLIGCVVILPRSRADHKVDLVRMPPARPGTAVVHARLLTDDGRIVHWQWTIVGAHNWNLRGQDSFPTSNPHVSRLVQRARTPAEDALAWSEADGRPNEMRPHACVYDWRIVPIKGMGESISAWSIET